MLSLLVDDDRSIRQYIAMVLQREDFQTIEAGDGVQGLQIVEELGDAVDLIITDIQMPNCDGVTFAQAVTKAYPDISIILVSGRGEPIEHFDGFVEKPFQARELADTVRNAMTHKAEYVLG
jgi:two-component system cell cycle sensor histidine kinase/response regulator CckA